MQPTFGSSDSEKPENKNVLGDGSLERSKQAVNKTVCTSRDLPQHICRKSFCGPWQSGSLLAVCDGQPAKYTRVKCDTPGADMKLTGEADPVSVQQALVQSSSISPKELFQRKRLTSP